MKTFAIKGKKYRWNPKASPLYVPVAALSLIACTAGLACLVIVAAACPI